MLMRTLPFAALLLATSSAAFPQFETKVPNGRSIGCLTCHTHSGGGEGWNDFGQEILREGGANPDANPNNQNLGYNGEGPQWGNLCDLDSDGDGASNGTELADPGCGWAPGDADPSGTVSAPGDAASLPGDPGDTNNPDNGREPLPGDTGNADPGGCASTGAGGPAALALLGLGLVFVRRRR